MHREWIINLKEASLSILIDTTNRAMCAMIRSIELPKTARMALSTFRYSTNLSLQTFSQNVAYANNASSPYMKIYASDSMGQSHTHIIEATMTDSSCFTGSSERVLLIITCLDNGVHVHARVTQVASITFTRC